MTESGQRPVGLRILRRDDLDLILVIFVVILVVYGYHGKRKYICHLELALQHVEEMQRAKLASGFVIGLVI